MRSARGPMVRSSLAFLLALIALATPMVARAEPGLAQGDLAGRIDVDGRKLYLECKGKGRPPAMLISGYRNNAAIWMTPPKPGVTLVFDGVAAFTRVCAYDRPGTILDATHL